MKRPVLLASYVSKQADTVKSSGKLKQCDEPAGGEEPRKAIGFSVSNDCLIKAYKRCSSLQRDGEMLLKLSESALYLCTSSKGLICEARIDLVERCQLPIAGAIAFAAPSLLLSIVVSKVGRKTSIGAQSGFIEFELPEILLSGDGIQIPETADLWTIGVGVCKITWPVQCRGTCEPLSADGEKVLIDAGALAASLVDVTAIEGSEKLARPSEVLVSDGLVQGGRSAWRMIRDARLTGVELWVERVRAQKLAKLLRSFTGESYIAENDRLFTVADGTAICTIPRGDRPSSLDLNIKPDRLLASFSVGTEALRNAINNASLQGCGISPWIEIQVGKDDVDQLGIAIAVVGGAAICTCLIQRLDAIDGDKQHTGITCEIRAEQLHLLCPLEQSSSIVIQIYPHIVVCEESNKERVMETILKIRK